jgi:predicted ATPase
MIKPHWYVLTGAPCSGKTSIIEELKHRGFVTFPEAARQVMDEYLSNGMSAYDIRKSGRLFEEQVLMKKIHNEFSAPTDIL